MKRRLHARRKGLTLLELVMVLVILTALAAILVPVIDYIRRTSDKSTASFAIKQVAENIALYRTTEGVYPGGLDALLSGSGTANATGAHAAMGLSSKITDKTTVDTLAQDELDKMDDLISTVSIYNTSNPVYRNFPGNTGNQVVSVGSSGQSSFRVLTDTTIIDSIYPGASTNVSGTFPNMVESGLDTGQIAVGVNPDGTTFKTARLIVLGVGPQAEAVGKTMQASPAYMGVDGLTTYNRFMAIFAVYDGFTQDKRPQLKGSLDSTMDFLNQEIIEVLENESA